MIDLQSNPNANNIIKYYQDIYISVTCNTIN